MQRIFSWPDRERVIPLGTTVGTRCQISHRIYQCNIDGRILYTRWEYLDKGAVSVKCLWSMRPDGSGSSEVYGADVFSPPTLIQPPFP